jgi:hypothetical protein
MGSDVNFHKTFTVLFFEFVTKKQTFDILLWKITKIKLAD